MPLPKSLVQNRNASTNYVAEYNNYVYYYNFLNAYASGRYKMIRLPLSINTQGIHGIGTSSLL